MEIANTSAQSGAHFTPGAGEQHTGPALKTRKKKLQELIDLLVLRRIQESMDTPDPDPLVLDSQAIARSILNEISYRAFHQSVTRASPRQQLSRSMKLVNSKLAEIEQILAHTQKLRETIAENERELDSPRKLRLKERIKGIYRTLHAL